MSKLRLAAQLLGIFLVLWGKLQSDLSGNNLKFRIFHRFHLGYLNFMFMQRSSKNHAGWWVRPRVCPFAFFAVVVRRFFKCVLLYCDSVFARIMQADESVRVFALLPFLLLLFVVFSNVSSCIATLYLPYDARGGKIRPLPSDLTTRQNLKTRVTIHTSRLLVGPPHDDCRGKIRLRKYGLNSVFLGGQYFFFSWYWTLTFPYYHSSSPNDTGSFVLTFAGRSRARWLPKENKIAYAGAKLRVSSEDKKKKLELDHSGFRIH